jgi:hypothetical protein
MVSCGGDDASGSERAASTTSTTRRATTVPAPGDLVPCDQLAGRETTDVLETTACDAGGSVVYLGTAAYDCADGRSLHWADHGWGWSDGVWQLHARPDGQLVPPDADMAACEG